MIITRSCKKNVCAFLKKKAPQLKKTSLHQAWSLGAMSLLGSHSTIRANRKAREVQVPALIPGAEQFFFTLGSFTLGSTNFSETPAISFSRVLPHTCGWNIFLSNTSPQLYANTATHNTATSHPLHPWLTAAVIITRVRDLMWKQRYTITRQLQPVTSPSDATHAPHILFSVHSQEYASHTRPHFPRDSSIVTVKQLYYSNVSRLSRQKTIVLSGPVKHQ